MFFYCTYVYTIAVFVCLFKQNLEGQFKSTPQLISALDDLEELKARLQSQPSLMNSGEVDDTGAIRQRSNSLPWRSEITALDRRRAFNRSFRQPVRQRRGRPEERTTDLPQSNDSPLPLLPPLPSLLASSEDRGDPVIPPPPPPPPVPTSARLQPTSPQLLRSEIRSVVTAFRVRGCSLPPSVVSKLSTDVIQAINCGSLSDTTYSYISSRISELRRGRLAKTHDETGSNLIHWFQSMLLCVCAYACVQACIECVRACVCVCVYIWFQSMLLCVCAYACVQACIECVRACVCVCVYICAYHQLHHIPQTLSD